MIKKYQIYESIINRSKKFNIFDYSSYINSAWDILINKAKKFQNISFDLENDYLINGQRKTIYIDKFLRKDQPVKYRFDAELWEAGGDWEFPVLYFRLQINKNYGNLLNDMYKKNPKYIWDIEKDYKDLPKCYVIIPPVEAGNRLRKSEDDDNHYHAYDYNNLSEKETKELKYTKEDYKKMWDWLYDLLKNAVDDRHIMLDTVYNNIEPGTDPNTQDDETTLEPTSEPTKLENNK